MPNVGDILQITIKHTLLGQNVFNLAFFEVGVGSDTTIPLATYADKMRDSYVATVMPILATDLSFQSLEIDNLTDGVSFASNTSSASGGTAGNPLPAFNAMTIKLNRATKITRNGSKRVAGLLEQNTEDGIIILTVAERQQIADWYGESQTYDSNNSGFADMFLDPVIIGRTLQPNGKYALDLSRVNRVTSATSSNVVSSQVSRKP